MKSPREVVVTGLGVVSPIGIGIDAFMESLRAGRSGVVRLDEYADSELPFHLGAPVRDFDGKNFVQPRKSLKVMSREIQTAYGAADLALKHASLGKEQVDPDRFGVVLGSEMLYGDVSELAEAFRHCTHDRQFRFDEWGKNAMQDIFPLWMLKYLPNMAACHVGIAHDARGPNNTIMQEDASSLVALMEGVSYIQRDLADVVIVGGTGSRLSEPALPFRGALDVSNWQGDPAEASRPFDRNRDGMVFGEGAGMLVLESRDHAQRRGARILARIAGFASRMEGRQREARTGQSIRNAIVGALDQAEIEPGQVGHVNANGNSLPLDDRLEAAAIRDTLGDTPVTALKSYFGYLGAGTGAVELAASVWGVAEGFVPPTLNYQTPDPDCPVRVIHGEPLVGAPPVAISLNHTPLGQAAAVVVAGQ
jgi:3-oxoacyl-[acyl-carrier-protein] synthase II